jgi:hypothetical protein
MRYLLLAIVLSLCASSAAAQWQDATRADAMTDEVQPAIGAVVKGTKMSEQAVLLFGCNPDVGLFLSVNATGLRLVAVGEPSYKLRVDKGKVEDAPLVRNNMGIWTRDEAERLAAAFKRGDQVVVRATSAAGKSADFRVKLSGFSDLFRATIPRGCPQTTPAAPGSR